MTSCIADPASRTPAQWSARLAALKSRAVPDDDPEVVAARQALSYWRTRRAIDAEAGQIAPGHLDALMTRLREAASR